MVRKLFNVLIFISVLTGSLNAQNISAEASTDTTAYQVGDYIHYTILIKADKNITVFGPSVSDTLAGLELISQSNPGKEESDNRQIISYSYTFSKYDSSDITIPPVRVYYKVKNDTSEKSVNTNQIYFTVRPLKVNVKADIKDVKDPLKIPLDWRWIALWVVTGLLIIAAAYYFYRRYKKQRGEFVPEKVVVRVPPHVAAINALRALREKQLWQKGMIKEYHSEITGIIRKYFEERFDMPALEMTTGETLDELRKRNGSERIIEETENFLNNADLVKFAKYLPLASVNEEMMKQAEQIVRKTRSESSETINEVVQDVR